MWCSLNVTKYSTEDDNINTNIIVLQWVKKRATERYDGKGRLLCIQSYGAHNI